MRTFKILLLGVGTLALMLLGVGFFLPTDFDWRTSIDVAAPPARIHPMVTELNRWEEWSPFQDLDATTRVETGDPSRGVGATQRWDSREGSVLMTVTASDPEQGIRYTLAFDDDAAQAIDGGLRYERVGRKTRVTWFLTGDLGGRPLGGYFVKLLRPMLLQLFDQGLERLKVRVESEIRNDQ